MKPADTGNARVVPPVRPKADAASRKPGNRAQAVRKDNSFEFPRIETPRSVHYCTDQPRLQAYYLYGNTRCGLHMMYADSRPVVSAGVL